MFAVVATPTTAIAAVHSIKWIDAIELIESFDRAGKGQRG